MSPALQALEDLENQPAHTHTIAQWARKCLRAARRRYAEPKALPQPALALETLTRAQRVAIYTERAACGQCLYHPGDLWRRQPTDDSLQIGVTAEHEANGAPVVHQRLSVRR